ncbi:unnamed protein product [Gulo gulo]|uniref:Uncharacterized protein n=1 Tax=Gulo gulo TaxID=48420 RepID=A0A9X9M871_GULGU|nr:unnamed protein product [Gulo gulo]
MNHASSQMNMMEVDKVTGRMNSQFKCYLWGHSEDDSILQLAKAHGTISKNF